MKYVYVVSVTYIFSWWSNRRRRILQII